MKSPFNDLLTKKLTRKEFLIECGVIIVTLTGIAGVIHELMTHAATPFTTAEPENGTIKTPATVVTDSTASGGKAIGFTAATPPPVPPPVPPPTPPPAGGPMVGTYMGGPNGGDDAAKNLFGVYPAISSTYYQYNQATMNGLTLEKARVDKGINPLITWTTKNSTYMEDIANGTGAGYTALQQYVASLNTLANYAATKGLKVYAAFDHEPDVKIVQKMLPANVTAEMYANALSKFITLCRANAPKVVTLFWYAGTQTALIDQMGSALTVLPDMYTFDPYSTTGHATTETFEQLVKPKMDWLKGRSWYKNKPIALSEFGADHTDAQMAQFYSNIHAHCTNLGLAFAVFFNRTDEPFVITLDQTNYPLSVAAFSKSMKGA